MLTWCAVYVNTKMNVTQYKTRDLSKATIMGHIYSSTFIKYNFEVLVFFHYNLYYFIISVHFHYILEANIVFSTTLHVFITFSYYSGEGLA